MTKNEMISAFREFDDEFLKFENIPFGKLHSKRSDLQALIHLDKIIPGDENIIETSEHDEVRLSLIASRVANFMDRDDILMLVRCGVLLDESCDSFYIFT